MRRLDRARRIFRTDDGKQWQRKYKTKTAQFGELDVYLCVLPRKGLREDLPGALQKPEPGSVLRLDLDTVVYVYKYNFGEPNSKRGLVYARTERV